MAAIEKADRGKQARDEFTEKELTAVDTIIDRYRHKPGSLIPVLEEIQERIGYLPKSIMARVALGLRLSYSEVYGVVTFYSFFTMVPRGRHTIRCCLGTACYVRGGRKNLQKLRETLKLDPGETTGDRRFSLETVRCLGACGLAPVMMVDDDTYRQVKPSQIPAILNEYE
ncbi:MAG: NADH-quinone oxidoreductase subunit NuoE [Desulfobacteraceae bacterium]|nr:MAG: NADH-quinone oxidoreductase subunit NuoE [Desulfobacteraceae bacterium]